MNSSEIQGIKALQVESMAAGSMNQLTGSFPREELYGLSSQLRRRSSSIPANLAEGCSRRGDAELARFCSIAMGSASELEYHLLLARDLKMIPAGDYARAQTQVPR